MSLMKEWENIVEKNSRDAAAQQKFWTDYYVLEKGIYEKLLEEPDKIVTGTVAELAKIYDVKPAVLYGFLDGINDSLNMPNTIESLEEDSKVVIDVNIELLYKNMVAAKADWLYDLPQWDAIIPDERRKELYKEQKSSTTIVKGKKIGRNEPCPCKSGKKYKHCCGR